MVLFDIEQRYTIFKEQKNRFVEGLRKIPFPGINLLLNWKDVSVDKPGNWFIMFAPENWGRFKHGFSGVHYTSAYRQERTRDEYVRLSLGVERPMREEFKTQFKMDVVNLIKSKRLYLADEFDLWPLAGIQKGKKLLETRVLLTEDAWKETLARYSLLDEFNQLVAEALKRYNDEGKFTAKLTFL